MTKLQIAKSNAIKLGWNSNFVNQVANLEWSQLSLERECIKLRVNTKQKDAILEVCKLSRLDIISQVNL